MIELKGLKRIIYNLLKKIGFIREKRITKEQQKKMCERAIKSNICPHYCETCVWGVEDEKTD